MNITKTIKSHFLTWFNHECGTGHYLPANTPVSKWLEKAHSEGFKRGVEYQKIQEKKIKQSAPEK